MASAFIARSMAEQQDAGRCGEDVELGLRRDGPVEDLDRHRGEAAQDAVRVEADEDQTAEQQQRCGLAQRPRQGEDRAGGDAGDGGGSVWRQTVCHWVAPSASEPSRISAVPRAATRGWR